MSLAFRFLTRDSTWAHYQFLVFQIASKMSINGISLKYVRFITSLSIFKGTVHINETNLEKCKIGLLLLNF